MTPWTAAHQASLSFTIFQSFVCSNSCPLSQYMCENSWFTPSLWRLSSLDVEFQIGRMLLGFQKYHVTIFWMPLFLLRHQLEILLLLSEDQMSFYPLDTSSTFSLSLIFSNLTMIWASQLVLMIKDLPANAGNVRDVDLIPGWGWSPGGGNSNPLQPGKYHG